MPLSLIAGCIFKPAAVEYPHRLGAIQIVAMGLSESNARWLVAEEGPERLWALLAFVPARWVMY
jgi:hypothetical protein